jgi:hypothetical protein
MSGMNWRRVEWENRMRDRGTINVTDEREPERDRVARWQRQKTKKRKWRGKNTEANADPHSTFMRPDPADPNERPPLGLMSHSSSMLYVAHARDAAYYICRGADLWELLAESDEVYCPTVSRLALFSLHEPRLRPDRRLPASAPARERAIRRAAGRGVRPVGLRLVV